MSYRDAEEKVGVALAYLALLGLVAVVLTIVALAVGLTHGCSVRESFILPMNEVIEGACR